MRMTQLVGWTPEQWLHAASWWALYHHGEPPLPEGTLDGALVLQQAYLECNIGHPPVVRTPASWVCDMLINVATELHSPSRPA